LVGLLLNNLLNENCSRLDAGGLLLRQGRCVLGRKSLDMPWLLQPSRSLLRPQQHGPLLLLLFLLRLLWQSQLLALPLLLLLLCLLRLLCLCRRLARLC
jgi:hypothetical protein